MSVKQVNFGNCVKEFEFPLLRISQNVKTKNYERLVFEQEKGPVVQWLSCIIISRNAISKVHKICVQKPETSHGTLLQYARVNIPCYHVCTGLNPKNLFETLKSYYYNFVVHVPLNIFKTQ